MSQTAMRPDRVLELLGARPADVKKARGAGYTTRTIAWAVETAYAPILKRERAETLADLASIGERRMLAPVDPDAGEGALRELARARADWMLDTIAEMREPVTHEWLDDMLSSLEARPFGDAALWWGCVYAQAAAEVLAPALWLAFVRKITDSLELELRGRVKRATCRHWWTRNVRRAATRKREAREQAAGRISVRTAPYVGDDTAGRWQRQQARNVAMLERQEIESADGEIVTLAAAMQATTANPTIRRGELMTRIKGAEQWAAARGMVGLFTTNTLPSRFHAQHFKGGMNAAYDGSTPRDGQGWLCRTWARARSALQRRRVEFFGFRVAEPHHDGCPHWHMLLFVSSEQAQVLTDTLRAYWLADAGDEPGADRHRFKAVEIDPAKGDAAGYVAKYIAKNIDDTGLAAHLDEVDGVQVEIDTNSGNKARRVLAWASAWGIRQFQAIGQPPVTVWRELRRVQSDAVQGASYPLRQAHAAVNRDGARKACWRAYMDAQGGAMQGRDNRLKLATELESREGLYGVTEAPRIVGVVDVNRPGETVLTGRKAWKPRGTWTDGAREAATIGATGAVRDWLFARPKAAQPWTRVNNCTRRGGAPFLMAAGIVGAQIDPRAGGQLESPCPSTSPPSPPSPSAWQPPPLKPGASLSFLRACWTA